MRLLVTMTCILFSCSMVLSSVSAAQDLPTRQAPATSQSAIVNALPGSGILLNDAFKSATLVALAEVADVVAEPDAKDDALVRNFRAHAKLRIIVKGEQREDVAFSFSVDTAAHETALQKGVYILCFKVAESGQVSLIKATDSPNTKVDPGTLPGSQMSLKEATGRATIICVGNIKILAVTVADLGSSNFRLELSPEKFLKGDRDSTKLTFQVPVKSHSKHESLPVENQKLLFFLVRDRAENVVFLKAAEPTDETITTVAALLSEIAPTDKSR